MGCIIKFLREISGFRLWKTLAPRLDVSFGCIVFLAMGLLLQEGRADHQRTQIIHLEAGWNAIALSVHPEDAHPAVIMSGLPVDIVATYDGVESAGQFTTDPSVDKLRQLGWGTWYAPARADAFLSDLGAMYGNKTYLIHATEPVVLSIEGEVIREEVRWKPNAFNLVGYTLDQHSPPTFAQFFDASNAHRGQAVFRLVNGVWSQVQNLDATLMRDGEAFWIYCDGSSTFRGPLSVETTIYSGLVLEDGADDLVLRNLASHPIEPTVQHIATGPDSVPMAVVIDVVGEHNLTFKPVPVSMGEGDWTQRLPVLEVGEATRMPLQLRVTEAAPGEMKSLICVKTDLGTETWVPVTGFRGDSK